MNSLGTLWCQILVLWIALYCFFIFLSSCGGVSSGKGEKTCFVLNRAGYRPLASGALMMKANIYCSSLALFSTVVTAMTNSKCNSFLVLV